MSMTRSIHVTDLREVKALALTCGKCGCVARLELDRIAKADCPFCRAEWPQRSLALLADAVRSLNGPDQTAVRVEVETYETLGVSCGELLNRRIIAEAMAGSEWAADYLAQRIDGTGVGA